MKIFIDSANPDEIRSAIEWGMVDGVTTNPSLATKAGVNFADAVKQILDVVKGPVSLEVLATDAMQMIDEARKLSGLGNQVVVKLPTTSEGLKALKVLSGENIKTNMTLVFSPIQALLVAKLRATFVSPFLGRIDDISPDGGMVLLDEVIQIYQNYDFDTQVLAASIRNNNQVREAALLGTDVVTVPYPILQDLVSHKLTDQGLDKFISDWKNSGQSSLV